MKPSNQLISREWFIKVLWPISNRSQARYHWADLLHDILFLSRDNSQLKDREVDGDAIKIEVRVGRDMELAPGSVQYRY
jgi:hypothetical protein